MKKIQHLGLIVAWAMAFGACESMPSAVTYAGGDGTVPEKAVVIVGAKNEDAGIRAEYAWINQNYPGNTKLGQSLTTHKGKPQDVITIRTSAGEELKVHFDISGFFGKLGN